MNKYLTENKKIFSFDKSFSTNITFSQPDKYKLLEKISHTSDNLINIGSNLSYSPLGFSRKSLSINIKNFDRILHFDKREKTITVEAGLTLIEFFVHLTNRHSPYLYHLRDPTIS